MKEEKLELLIYKKLKGEITGQELRELEAWTPDFENMPLYRQIQLIWDKSRHYVPVENPVDISAEFETLLNRIGETEKVVKKDARIISFTKPKKFWMGAAAAVILLFVVFQGILFFSDREEMIVVTTKAGEKKEILLPDSSLVVVNQQSVLEYPKKFEAHKRILKLKGEAYFKVKRDVDSPFSIETAHTITTVLGTSFAIRAYVSEPLTKVIVKSGKVRFQAINLNQSTLLEAYDGATFDNVAMKFATYRDAKLKDLDWLESVLEFENETLSQVIAQVQKEFEIAVRLENQNLADCPFTGRFVNADAETVLNAVSLTYDMQRENKSGVICLSGGKCK